MKPTIIGMCLIAVLVCGVGQSGAYTDETTTTNPTISPKEVEGPDTRHTLPFREFVASFDEFK